MAAYIAIILSSISIVLLIAVLLKFKKLFSTESLIENTKIKMNKIISDINKNANMDIDLINEATRRTRQLIKETDEKMEEFKEASQMLRDMIATVEHQTKQAQSQIPIFKTSLMEEIKPIGRIKSIEENKDFTKTENKTVGQANSIKAKAYSSQLSLFDDDNTEKEKDMDISTNKSFVAAVSSENNVQEGDVIPNIVTNIVAPDNFVSKKSLNDRVERMFGMGMQVEDIALELSCSVSEVQFIIDMLGQ